MSTVGERARENVTGLFTLLVLGLGFVALFADFEYFFLIWVLGYAVGLPILAILTGEHEEDTHLTGHEHGTTSSQSRDESARSTNDALATLRDRYARGDLTDEQFERKLDALLETDSPEAAAEWRAREHETDRADGRVTERERQ